MVNTFIFKSLFIFATVKSLSLTHMVLLIYHLSHSQLVEVNLGH